MWPPSELGGRPGGQEIGDLNCLLYYPKEQPRPQPKKAAAAERAVGPTTLATAVAAPDDSSGSESDALAPNSKLLFTANVC